MDQAITLFTDNWGWISTALITVLGAYGIKIKRAVNDLQAVVKDVQETQAVYKDAMADNKITTEEAEKLGKELQEDLVKIQAAAASVTALIPERFRKKIPVDFA